MKKDAKKAAKATGARTLSDFVRRAIANEIAKSKAVEQGADAPHPRQTT